MALADLPDDIIARLRDQVPGFADRVAGAAAEARAADETSLALPCAFVLPAGIEQGEPSLSSLDQMMPIRVRLMIGVTNTSDARGQASTSAFLALAVAAMQALVGWTPDGTVFAPFLAEGIEDDFTSTRAALWGTLTFRTEAALSDL